MNDFRQHYQAEAPLKRKWGALAVVLWSLGFAIASCAIFVPIIETVANITLAPVIHFLGEEWAESNIPLVALIVIGTPLVVSVGLGFLVVIARNKWVLPRQIARAEQTGRERHVHNAAMKGAGSGTRRAERQGGAPRITLDMETVVNVLSLAVVLSATYEALGIGSLFAYQGLSNDDAEARKTDEAVGALFNPIGFLIMLGLLIASIIIYVIARSAGDSDGMPKVSLILTSILFVMGFFRVSVIFPLLFVNFGWMSATAQNAPDIRVPTAQEFTLDPVELIQYQRGEGIRISTAVTNTGSDHWQTASVSIVYSDANGVACGRLVEKVEFVAPGAHRMIVTDFLAAQFAYSDRSCIPVSTVAEVTSIDIDSRAEIAPSDYEQAQERATLTPLTALAIAELPQAFGRSYLAVAGSVDPAALPGLIRASGKALLPLGFEAIDQQGLRLAWCFKTKDLGPDGTFTTGQYHSPVDPGQFVSVAVVPKC